MDNEQLDAFVIDVMDLFNKKQDLEEKALKKSKFSDLTVKELHTIVQVGLNESRKQTDIAKELGVTMGTLSVSIKRLVDKGYIQRDRDPNDRRKVYLFLTKRGRVMYRLNLLFYRNLVKTMAKDRSEEELATLMQTMREVHQFILDTYHLLDED
ncbi:MarR family transcriptional regulator [Aerococcaceae bacterium DSM 111020]|nr:MarR family transcriptional regulator [Aerococcaceae bacterium DSM 111020]